MIIHKASGLQFNSLKEAKIALGTGRFHRLCKNGEIEFTPYNR